ncbi:hypothetical protein K0U07_04960, partial [bacterium]|nr:hypothetical protein [bacterium]
MVFASSSPRESYEVQRWVKFPVPSGQGGPFARAVDVRLDKVKEFVAHRFSWPEEWGESINGKKIQAFAARVVEVIILGPTMCVISCTLYFLPDRVARLVVNFFASPWVFLPEDCECRTFKEIAMIISTLVPAYLIGFFCNRIFVPILFKACSWVVNKAKFIKPIDSRFGVANILALFLVYIVAMRIQKNGKTIVCANRVGPFSNFFVADVGRHSGAVRVVLGRQFLVSYPALVLQEMGAYYRTYLDLGNSDRQSKQFEAMEGVLEYQNDNTRVIFQREKGRGQGITKN